MSEKVEMDWLEYSDFWLKNRNSEAVPQEKIDQVRLMLAKTFFRNSEELFAEGLADEYRATLELHTAMWARSLPDEVVANAIDGERSLIDAGQKLMLTLATNYVEPLNLMRAQIEHQEKLAKIREENGEAEVVALLPNLQKSQSYP